MHLTPDNRPPRRYRLYGRTIDSAYPMVLPSEAGPSTEPAHIDVRYDGIVARETDDPFTSSHPPDAIGRVWKQMPRGFRMLRYYNATGYMTQYMIRADGREIRMSQSWPEWRDSVFGLMNPALAAAIVLSGTPVLHGSSLVRNGRSFFFMGVSGAGKSSLSAALAASGMMTHSDDIGVLSALYGTGPVVVQPGYGQIKVTPDLPARIGLKHATLRRIYASEYAAERPAVLPADDHGRPLAEGGVDIVPEIEEQWLMPGQLPAGWYPKPAPLAGIFVLSKRKPGLTEPEVTPLHGMPAVVALTDHLYGRDWLQLPSAGDLPLCRHLAASAPVWRVHMPDDLALLMDAAQRVLRTCIAPAAP